MEKLKIERMNGMTEEELNKVIKVDIQLDIDKLNRIYDLEKELGIPLEVLFKALKEGIWTKGGNYDPCFLDATPNFMKNLDLHIGYCGYSQYDSEEFDNYFGENDALCIFTMDYEEHNYVTRLKDYGKTWGLTKEELE